MSQLIPPKSTITHGVVPHKIEVYIVTIVKYKNIGLNIIRHWVVCHTSVTLPFATAAIYFTHSMGVTLSVYFILSFIL
jgi:hypothetical protein